MSRLADNMLTASQGSPLRHHITENGLLFVAISDDAPSFEEYLPDLTSVAGHVDFRQRPYRRSIAYEGRFNWKTMYGVSRPTCHSDTI